MRKPEEQNRASVYFESDDVDIKKPNIEADPKVNSKGVLGYPEIFRIIPNLPLSAHIDTMHDILKGVVENLLEFLFRIFSKNLEEFHDKKFFFIGSRSYPNRTKLGMKYPLYS